jgi:hypothetical protein
VVIAQVGSQVSTPQWLPDGKHILLVDNERINNRFREGYNKLRVIDLATGPGTFYAVAPAPRQISERDEGAAVLSPDGTKVAFIMDSLLHVMPLNPTARRPARRGWSRSEAADLPSWGGDSRTILYKAADKLKHHRRRRQERARDPVNSQWTQAVPKGTTLIRAGACGTATATTLRYRRRHRDRRQPHRLDPSAPGGSEAQACERFIDASGLTVMPGLWDPLPPADAVPGRAVGAGGCR